MLSDYSEAHSFKNEQDVYVALANLVKAHPSMPRWMFKINREVEGRGIAFIGICWSCHQV